MGETAENVAEKYNITRDRQDEFAYQSQLKWQHAQEHLLFENEIVPVMVPQKKGQFTSFHIDEHPRLSTVDVLSTLKPAFKDNGSVTAGNSSGINDGAACCILASESMVKQFNLKPIARIVSCAAAGVDPSTTVHVCSTKTGSTTSSSSALVTSSTTTFVDGDGRRSPASANATDEEAKELLEIGCV